MTDLGPIRTYEVSVRNYGSVFHSARSPGKARARAFRDFTEVWGVTFKEFLRISSVRRTENPPYFRRAIIAGQPGTIIYSPHKGIRFMRDDSEEVMSAHPSEIQEIAA